MKTRIRGWLVLMALTSALLLACGGSNGSGNENENQNSNDNVNVNDNGNTNVNDNTNTNSNDNGNTNTNTNGNTTPTGGYPGLAVVAGGNVMTSTNYRLVLTTGEGPGGNAAATSTNYRLQGGLVGATE